MGEHKRDRGHDFPPNNINILDSKEQWLRRHDKEALFIKERDPDLNRDHGIKLPQSETILYHMIVTSRHMAQS